MKKNSRHQARFYALQALYQRHLSNNPITSVEEDFLGQSKLKNFDTDYFHDLLHGVNNQLEQLQAVMQPFLDRRLTELSIVELCVLRMATYELTNRLDVPYRVIINEALELTKLFGAEEGFKYVNGILDKVAKEVRPIEVNQQEPKQR